MFADDGNKSKVTQASYFDADVQENLLAAAEKDAMAEEISRLESLLKNTEEARIMETDVLHNKVPDVYL